MAVIAEGVSMVYKRSGKTGCSFTALENTSIAIESGRITVISGRSGSGKTTLLNILAGLLRPSSGTVFYDGTDIYALDDERLSVFRNKHIGYVPQGQSALANLTVLENLMLPLSLAGGGDGGTKARHLLEEVGISALADAYPDELSGGELRRLAAARALVNTPEVIFADEPTNDLDDENTALVLGLLKKAAEDGAAVVLVTHEALPENYADTIYRTESGKITKTEGQ